MRIPQVGDMVVCYGKTDNLYNSEMRLLFKALIIENDKKYDLWTASVIYADKVYRYKPLDTWSFNFSDWKGMLEPRFNSNKWFIEDGT